jgi:hypothetical protein
MGKKGGREIPPVVGILALLLIIAIIVAFYVRSGEPSVSPESKAFSDAVIAAQRAGKPLPTLPPMSAQDQETIRKAQERAAQQAASGPPAVPPSK